MPAETHGNRPNPIAEEKLPPDSESFVSQLKSQIVTLQNPIPQETILKSLFFLCDFDRLMTSPRDSPGERSRSRGTAIKVSYKINC
jgi:hypothetical protein